MKKGQKHQSQEQKNREDAPHERDAVPYVSVIIPAYNEQARITKTLLATDKYLSGQDFSYEIVVVDDGSKDDTVSVVKNLSKIVKHLSLIENEQNHGKGYVVRRGMLEARGRIRLFMDADNATTADHFEKMRPHFDKGAQVVIGSRDPKDAEGARQAVPQSLFKRMLGTLGNFFIQIVLGLWGIWDTQCGFKAVTARAAQDIFSRTTVDRWGFDAEMLAISKVLRYTIVKIPVNWINDPNTHVSMRAYLQVLWETVKIRMNLWAGKYNIRK